MVRELVLWSSRPMPHFLLQEGPRGLYRTVRALGGTWGVGGAWGLATEAGAQVTTIGTGDTQKPLMCQALF